MKEKLTKKAVITKCAPAPVGAYSQAVQMGQWLFLSGQIPLSVETQKMVVGDMGVQTEQVMKNIQEVLQSVGASFSNVVKVTIFLKDMKHFPQVNDVYSQYFKSPFPARSCVAVRDLPKGAELEIEAIAYLD